jgi:hypothetical protein
MDAHVAHLTPLKPTRSFTALFHNFARRPSFFFSLAGRSVWVGSLRLSVAYSRRLQHDATTVPTTVSGGLGVPTAAARLPSPTYTSGVRLAVWRGDQAYALVKADRPCWQLHLRHPDVARRPHHRKGTIRIPPAQRVVAATNEQLLT